MQCVTCQGVIIVEVDTKTCKAHATLADKCKCGMKVRMRVRSPTEEEKQVEYVAVNIGVGDGFRILKDVISDLDVTYEVLVEGNQKFLIQTKQMDWDAFGGEKLEQVLQPVFYPNPPDKA